MFKFKSFQKLPLMIIRSRFCSTKTILEQKIKIGPQIINYVDVGSGPKTVVCVPGALGTIWSDFHQQIKQLNREMFRIIAFDPPGYGQSRPPNKQFTTDFYRIDANIVQQFLTKIGIQKYSLLGWSDGGIVSMILAAKYTNNVEKLVVWGANSYIAPEEVQLYERVRDVSQWSDRMKAPLVKVYTEAGLRTLWESFVDNIKEIARRNGGDICRNDLKNIKCPTLILHGDLDPMVATEHPGYLHDNIVNSKLYRFPNGKHNIHLRYPTEFNEIVTNFLITSQHR